MRAWNWCRWALLLGFLGVGAQLAAHAQESSSANFEYSAAVTAGGSASREDGFTDRSANYQFFTSIGATGSESEFTSSSNFALLAGTEFQESTAISLVTPKEVLTGSNVPLAIVGRATHWLTRATGTWSNVQADTPSAGKTTLTASGSPGWTPTDLPDEPGFAGLEFFPNHRSTTRYTIESNGTDTIVVNGAVTGVSAGDTFFIGTNCWLSDGVNDLKINGFTVVGSQLILADLEAKYWNGSSWANAPAGSYDLKVMSPDVYGDREQIVVEDAFTVHSPSAGAPTLSIDEPDPFENITGSTFGVDLSYSADKEASSLIITCDAKVDDGSTVYPAGTNIAPYLNFSYGSTSASATATKSHFKNPVSGSAYTGAITFRARIADVEGNLSIIDEVTCFIDGTNAGDVTSVSPASVHRGETNVSVTVTFGITLDNSDWTFSAPTSTGITFSHTSNTTSSVTFDLSTTSSTEIGRHVLRAIDNGTTYEFVFWVDYPVDGNGDYTLGPLISFSRDDEQNQPQEPPRNSVIGNTVGVFLSNGEYSHTATDLSIPGRGIGIDFSRTYRSAVAYHGVMGHNWDFSYNDSVEFKDLATDTVTWKSMGRLNDFLWDSTPTDTSYDAYYMTGSFLRVDIYNSYPGGTIQSDGTIAGDVIVITDPHKNKRVFTPLASDLFGSGNLGARLDYVQDRHGNTLYCIYNTIGQLVNVVDSLSRTIEIAYGDDGYLETIRDFDSRELKYTVDANGDLTQVDAPETDRYNGGSRINVKYEYDDDTDDKLEGAMSGDHYLTSITDGKSQEYLELYYDQFGGNNITKVVKQKYGGAGEFIYINYSGSDETGTSTDITGSVLTDSGASWGTNQWAGAIITIGVSTYRVLENTGSTVTVEGTIAESSPEDYSLPVHTNTVDRRGLKTIYKLNGNGTLQEQIRLTGTFDSDGENRTGAKVRTSDPEFFFWQFSYNSDLNLTQTILPRGNSLNRSFDTGDDNPQAHGNLTSVSLSDETLGSESDIVTQYSYEGEYNFVSSITDPRNNTTAFTYDYQDSQDGTGNLVMVTAPTATLAGGGTHTPKTYTAYNQHGQPVATTDAEGSTTSYSYYETGSQKGYLKQVVVDLGFRNLVTQFSFNAVGNPASITDPRGNTTHFNFNEFGQNILTTYPTLSSYSGGTYYLQQYFDENHNLEYVKWSEVEYDGTGPSAPTTFTNPASYTTANGWITTAYSYDELDFVTEVTEDVDSSTTRSTQFQYDANRNLTKTLMPVALLDSEDPDYDEDNHTSATFDERDLAFKVYAAQTGTDEALSELYYDLNGNVSELWAYRGKTYSGGGDDGKLVTSYVYDGFDRVIKILNDAGNYSKFKYDAASNVVESWFAEENGTNDNLMIASQTTFDALNRAYQLKHLAVGSGHSLSLSDAQSPSDLTISAKQLDANTDGWATTDVLYNRRGQPIKVTDDNGSYNQYFYDNVGWLIRQTSKHIADSTDNQQLFDYDRNGNLRTVIQLLVDSETDDITQLTNQTFYDELNRAFKMIDNDGSISTQSLNSLGIAQSADDAEGKTTERTYDLLGREKTVKYKNAGLGGDIVRTYVYDSNSRLESVTDPESNVTTYDYDSLNRLVQTSYADGTDADYSYDDLGNMWRYVDQANNQFDYDFDPHHNWPVQLDITLQTGFLRTSKEEYAYDALGGMTSAKNYESTDQIHDLSQKFNTLRQIDETTEQQKLRSVGGSDANLPARTIRNTFDGIGRHKTTQFSTHDPMGTAVEMEFTLDALGRVSSFTDPNLGGGSNTWSFEYLAGLRKKTASAGGKLQQTITRDADLRVTAMATTGTGSHSQGQLDFVGFDLSYNEVNQTIGFNRRHEGNTGNFYVYQENSTHRLSKSYAGVNQPHLLGTTAPSTDGDEYTSRLDYSLDDASDRLNKSTYIPNPASTGDLLVDYDENTFTNSPSGQEGDGRMHQPKILNDGALHEKDYRYDDNGNLLADKQFLYVYDAFNRLAQVWKDVDQDFAVDDPGDVCLMELWYDSRGLCCAVGYGPGFTGAGPNGIHGYSNYYGAGTVPIENGELELDSGNVREKLSGGDPIVSLQTFVPGLGAGTIQPVGGTDKFLPLLGPDGCVYAQADPSDGKIKERVRFGDFGRPVFNGIKASGTWSLVDPDGGGAGEPVSYSAGTTTIFAFAGEYSANYGTWDGLSLQPSVFGSPAEFAITDISYNYTADAWEIDVAGDATALVTESGYFEVIDSPTFAVTNVTFDNNSTPTNSVDDTTVITVSTSPGATDSLIGRLIIPDLNQPNVTFEIVDNLDSGGTYTLTVAGDATDLVSNGDYIRLPDHQSPIGNTNVGSFSKTWCGFDITVDGNVFIGPEILFIGGIIWLIEDVSLANPHVRAVMAAGADVHAKNINAAYINVTNLFGFNMGAGYNPVWYQAGRDARVMVARERNLRDDAEDFFRANWQKVCANAQYVNGNTDILFDDFFALWAASGFDGLSLGGKDWSNGHVLIDRATRLLWKQLQIMATMEDLVNAPDAHTKLFTSFYNAMVGALIDPTNPLAWQFRMICQGTDWALGMDGVGTFDREWASMSDVEKARHIMTAIMGEIVMFGVAHGVSQAATSSKRLTSSVVRTSGGKPNSVLASCFPAGTLVWVLRDGMDPEQAREAIVNGEPIESYAEPKVIEDIKPGDYVLSQPEDDPTAPLTFEEVLETYAHLNHQVEQLVLVDEETGEREVIAASSHPFWVVGTGQAGEPMPIANVWEPHLRQQRHYAEELAHVTDRHIRAEDVRQGFVLINADGRRITLTAQQARYLRERGYAQESSGWHGIPALVSDRGWCFSPDLREGFVLLGANGRRLRIEKIEWQHGPVVVYNLQTARTATYFVGRLQAWAHNNNSEVWKPKKVFHGTDSNSAESIMKKGLDEADNELFGNIKWKDARDKKGFSVTVNEEVAEEWARLRANQRGGNPVVLEADTANLPLNRDLPVDNGEWFVKPDDYGKVGPGVFRPRISE